VADDAAGAVRRTPRPAPEPELIYGTTRTDPVGTVREHDDGTTAVKVSMGDDSTKGQHVWCWMSCKLEVRWLHHYDVAEWAVLAAPEKRPVVLLPAEDCDCTPPYADCKHGPEPVDALDLALWLHAEANYFRNWTLKAAELELASHGQAEDKLTAELEDIRQHARNVAAQRDVEHRAFVEAAAERDLALWLHAELQHKLTLPCGECHACMNWADETWRRAGRKPPAVVTWEDKLAEAKSLDARLDDAIKLIEEMAGHLRQEPALTIGVETRLAALRGDQPTWEADRG
jgi:hypothetical protein